MASIQTLHDLFHDGLKDIYYAEKEILKTLDKTAKKTSSDELKQAMLKHRKETEQQIQRLEKVFQVIGEKPRGKTCPGIQGIIAEGSEHMQKIEDEMVRDAAIVAAAQAVEHYEITRYGTLAAWAEQMGHDEAVELLVETLEEEKKTDELLNELARTVNQQAHSEPDDATDMDEDEDEADGEMKRPKARQKPVKA